MNNSRKAPRPSLFDGSVLEERPKPAQSLFQPANFWFSDKPSARFASDDDDRHRFVYPDGEDDEECVTTKAPLPSCQTKNAPAAAGETDTQSRPDGAGTTIAILDTGINKKHQAFSNNKIIECKNFVPGECDDCNDENGHGTQCAGVACGLERTSDDGVTLKSAAPGAKLLVCKIAKHKDDDTNTICNAVKDALGYIIKRNEHENTPSEEKVDVISISFGFESFNKDVAMKIQEAISKNIIVVCCASNGGTSISNPITFPARLGHVLCIGACNEHGRASNFSSSGREIDFVELGENVWAPSIYDPPNNLKSVVGTSYSTPAVAGLICRLLQDLKRLSKELHDDMHNVWCIRELLKTMSTKRGHHDQLVGYGRLHPNEHYFKKGDDERRRICHEILGKN